MQHIKDVFVRCNIDNDASSALDSLLSLDIKLLKKKEFNQMLGFFNDFPEYQNLVPLLTDGNSNYWCLYSSGLLKNMVCYLRHDDQGIEPKFRNLASLAAAINGNPKDRNIDEFEEYFFDFPSKRVSLNYSQEKNIIKELYKIVEAEGIDEQIRMQTAFSIMALTSPVDIEQIIYPFLDDEDMYVQARAIDIIGFHSYKPAVAKLTELTKTAQYNGQSAAKAALKKIRFS